MKKKGQFQSSQLVKAFARFHGSQDILLAFEVKDYLETYLDSSLFEEIISVNIRRKVLEIKIASPLLKNDFRLRKTFFLNKFQQEFGEHYIVDQIGRASCRERE